MLYVHGNLSDNECAQVETITEQMHNTSKEDEQVICQTLINTVYSSYGITLSQIQLKHVFRIHV